MDRVFYTGELEYRVLFRWKANDYQSESNTITEI